jgi:hypothetical protein
VVVSGVAIALGLAGWASLMSRERVAHP